MKLNTKQIKKLKSVSHHIKPIITIGKEGVNEGVINSITEYLERHELIKIKFNKNKSEKNTLSENITNSTDSGLVSIIGNTLIIYKQSTNLKYRQIKL